MPYLTFKSSCSCPKLDTLHNTQSKRTAISPVLTHSVLPAHHLFLCGHHNLDVNSTRFQPQWPRKSIYYLNVVLTIIFTPNQVILFVFPTHSPKEACSSRYASEIAWSGRRLVGVMGLKRGVRCLRFV